jgi:hypothetical protein
LKRLILYLFLLGFSHELFSQERTIQGIVFDSSTKQRLSRVYIYNTRTHKGFYNNTKGEFSTSVLNGDVLVAAVEGYSVDTLTVRSQSTLLFYLRRSSVYLREVTITDTALNAQERLRRNQQEYKDAYRKGDARDILQVGGANGTGGAGLGIDALWSLLSREGKNARYLQKIIERDYRDQIINYRYNPRLVSQVTGLKDEQLIDFMQQYRPSYFFATDANDYVLIEYIKTSYQRYKKQPNANRLPPLIEQDKKP